MRGRNNRIACGTGVRAGQLVVDIVGNGNRLTISNYCRLKGRIVFRGDDQTVEIGPSTVFKDVYVLCSEGCDVTIGRHCLFSKGVTVRTTDAHSVIELTTGQRTNAPRSIAIGDHVWVSADATISKGAVIGDDSIVAAAAFVNRQFTEANVVIAGAPASVVKTGVTWHRGRQDRFSRSEMNSWRKDKRWRDADVTSASGAVPPSEPLG